ncbi:MAG: hypothetical protein Ta2A_07950 [Treponemataceae bacterium]|nr:MAG: hypothetical protein Ta2A_07950 [Treponemataceae bacterium]
MIRKLPESYKITGKIIHGKMLGRTVGMPTANFDTEPQDIHAPSGVYATIVHLAAKTSDGMSDRTSDRTLEGVTNVGLRPSIDNSSKMNVETHIFDFDEDIYGQTLSIELVGYIRPVVKFANLEAVKAQVQEDCEAARQFLRESAITCFPART